MTLNFAAYGAVKTISILLTIALIIICVFFGFLAFCSFAGMDVPTLGPFKIYLVLSDSMAPEIITDDAIIITKTTPETLEIGDVITFYAFESDTIITHRITGIEQTGQGYEFTTKGDNNNIEDSFTTPGDRVIGKYLTKISKFGGFLNGVTARPYIIALIIIPILLIQFLLGLLEKSLKKAISPMTELPEEEEAGHDAPDAR